MAFSWRTFWNNIKRMGENEAQGQKTSTNVVKWDDVSVQNPLDIVVKKLNALVNDEATISFNSDSTLTQPIHDLSGDILKKRYDICGTMLGKGGCYGTVATTESGQAYIRLLPPEDVSVYETSADKITEVAMIIDRKIVNKMPYILVRHHVLDENGTLYVYFYTLDKSGNQAFVAEWEKYKEGNSAFNNANHIGVTYFKSPQSSNGKEPFFGVPLNYACEYEEKRFIEAQQMAFSELQNGQSILFADESILQADNTTAGKSEYKLTERMYAIRKMAGVDGSLIDVYAPTSRYNDYWQGVINCGHAYEDRIGLNSGFVTPPEYTSGATASEIKTANAKTIAFINMVRATMEEGIKDLLTVANILLLLPLDLWSISVDWYDTFDKPEEVWSRLVEGKANGAAETSDLVAWLFPSLTPEEIGQKLVRIAEEHQSNTDAALERILNGQ